MKLAGARALAFCDKPQGKTRIALVNKMLEWRGS
jgi:hypothetical protein